MTNRYISRDIRDAVIDLLESATVGVNYYLDIIDTERSETTPDILKITYEWGGNQIPLITVDMERSETLVQESELTNSYEKIAEIYKCNVIVVSKSNSQNIINHIENYIEAIIRVLHGYNDSYITWISLTGVEQSELYKKENQMMKEATLAFEIRIN